MSTYAETSSIEVFWLEKSASSKEDFWFCKVSSADPSISWQAGTEAVSVWKKAKPTSQKPQTKLFRKLPFPPSYSPGTKKVSVFKIFTHAQSMSNCTQSQYLLNLLFSSTFSDLLKVFQYLSIESQMNFLSWSSSVYTEDKGSWAKTLSFPSCCTLSFRTTVTVSSS